MEKMIVRSGDISWKAVEDEIMIIDEHEGTYFCLNAEAAAVWRFLDASRTRNEILGFMEENFHIRTKKRRTEIARLVDDMLQKRFIVFHEEPE